MDVLGAAVMHVARQAADNATADSVQSSAEEAPPACVPGNDYDGLLGTRISSIFVILVGSALGAWFPVFARRHKSTGVPDWAFFIAKFFGSGVIIATAFIHLLAPANEALGDECLTGVIAAYPWPEGIALMTAFVMFVLELFIMRKADFGEHTHEGGHEHRGSVVTKTVEDAPPSNGRHPSLPGTDHFGHARDHVDNEDVGEDWQETGLIPESYPAQLTAIFILEFGVIFHSIFIGLTLAVADSHEFKILYVVLVFHQTFEGLGLGSRLAMVPWPKSKTWTPYILALAYGITTPIAIAIGIGVRRSYPPGSETALITNGVFDSISAGILLYVGFVELMAHEFMFSNEMRRASDKRLMCAVFLVGAGAGLMALLGYWA